METKGFINWFTARKIVFVKANTVIVLIMIIVYLLGLITVNGILNYPGIVDTNNRYSAILKENGEGKQFTLIIIGNISIGFESCEDLHTFPIYTFLTEIQTLERSDTCEGSQYIGNGTLEGVMLIENANFNATYSFTSDREFEIYKVPDYSTPITVAGDMSVILFGLLIAGNVFTWMLLRLMSI